MKKYAVSFMYQKIPKFDKIIFNGEHYIYYKGNKILNPYYMEPPMQTELPVEMSITTMQGESEREVMDKLRISVPYQILKMSIVEMGGDEK